MYKSLHSKVKKNFFFASHHLSGTRASVPQLASLSICWSGRLWAPQKVMWSQPGYTKSRLPIKREQPPSTSPPSKKKKKVPALLLPQVSTRHQYSHHWSLHFCHQRSNTEKQKKTTIRFQSCANIAVCFCFLPISASHMVGRLVWPVFSTYFSCLRQDVCFLWWMCC